MHISRLLGIGPALLRSRRPLALLMLGLALEMLCVVGRDGAPSSFGRWLSPPSFPLNDLGVAAGSVQLRSRCAIRHLHCRAAIFSY
jgi:hypothetical protein